MQHQLNIDPISAWLKKKYRPLIIAGPCSAETEEQIYITAKELVDNKSVDVFRAGVWKPRTRPNVFQGIGNKGLKWLQMVKKEFSLRVAVEVANSKHVEECLKHDIDILWIGARTTVNPFTVQEIADSLHGINIPVLIKNPINPDLELWLGAIERINNAGVTKIIAVHRGFSSYEATQYRNKPNWEIPLELKRRIPDLPLICDPSHICGSTELISSVAQKAMDLAYDGLMIEAHYNPTVALSDAEQQLTPQKLYELVNNLVYRKISSDNPEFISSLEKLRSIIDNIDAAIIENFKHRMSVVEKIAEFKRLNNITILQPERWNYIVERALKLGTNHNLSEDFIINLFNVIHRESIRTQTSIMNYEPLLVEQK